jgi:hypothetical protein
MSVFWRESRPRAGLRRLLALLVSVHALAWTAECVAATDLKRGSEAPQFALNDRAGAEVSSAKLRGRVAILIFGELYHEKTREAYAAIDAVVQDQRLAGQPVTPVVIVAHQERADDLNRWPRNRGPQTIVRDTDRQAFEAFHVAAMPSVIVVDREGRVVYAVAGLAPRFADLLMDSVLYACGKLTEEELERSLNPVQPANTGTARVRAERLTQLARQLARRGAADLAAEKYREALEMDPEHVSARMGLGTLLLNQRRLAPAEGQFRAVLAVDSESAQALLGLSYVQTLRGGAELEPAEKTVRAVLARSPANARAHYLLGLIQEGRNQPAEAAASFKRASELLLERTEQE